VIIYAYFIMKLNILENIIKQQVAIKGLFIICVLQFLHFCFFNSAYPSLCYGMELQMEFNSQLLPKLDYWPIQISGGFISGIHKSLLFMGFSADF